MTSSSAQSTTGKVRNNGIDHWSHYIVSCNNVAVSSLQQGDPVTALSIFKVALATANAQLDPEYDTGTLEVKAQPTDSICIRSADIFEGLESADICADKDVLDRFTRAFDIASLPTSGRCVALLYNMALSYDARTAFVSSKHNTSIFRATHAWRKQAMNLYQSALEIAISTWSAEEVAAMRCILLAITNNLGRLAALQMRHDETRECLALSRELLRPADAVHQIPPTDFELLYSSLGPFLYLDNVLLPVASAA